MEVTMRPPGRADDWDEIKKTVDEEQQKISDRRR